MGRINVVTRAEVEQAIQDLESQGKNPSIAAIQKLIGGGNTTLMRLKGEIDAEKRAIKEHQQNDERRLVENVILGLGEGYETALQIISDNNTDISTFRDALGDFRELWLEAVDQLEATKGEFERYRARFQAEAEEVEVESQEIEPDYEGMIKYVLDLKEKAQGSRLKRIKLPCGKFIRLCNVDLFVEAKRFQSRGVKASLACAHLNENSVDKVTCQTVRGWYKMNW